MRVMTACLFLAIACGNGAAQTLPETIRYISTKLETFEYRALTEPVIRVENRIRVSKIFNGSSEIEVTMSHEALVRVNPEAFQDMTVTQKFYLDNFYFNEVQELYGEPADKHVSMAHCCVSLAINCWKPRCVSATTTYKDGTEHHEYRNHAAVIVHQRHKEAVKRALSHAVKISGGREEPF